MGYGGNGITYSQIGSEIVAGAIAGITDQDADLFELQGPGLISAVPCAPRLAIV